MATVNITQAAKLARVSRTTFYNNYIRSGKITVSRDDKGNKCIDISELLRVFGEIDGLQGAVQEGVQSDVQIGQDFTVSDVKIEQRIRVAELEVENRLLKERMEDLKDQQSLDRKQIKDLSVQLLEYKPVRAWWQFWR